VQTVQEALEGLYRETSVEDVIEAVQRAQDQQEDLVGQQALF
jgi:hypothetical protein